MTDFIFSLGYAGLFLISFLSASLLPLASEVFVVGMPPLGYNVWGVILVATVGSYSGSLVNYAIGKKGTDFVLGRYLKIDPKTWARAERFYERWGPVALFFSWVPFIGDPLTAVAGALHMNLGIFSFWVLFGKTLRYLVLLGIASRFLNIF
ncbi:MAG: DedA family protein [Ardenticatenaceae bacterium]|nr:DedA family protein [Ardenticatenaceae bacterium]